MTSPPKILVAMSGGVDSSVAAALLLEKGFDVVGVTMNIIPGVPDRPSAVEDAARVARQLGIPHHIWDGRDLFDREIIEAFAQEYCRGRTPNPCVCCNRRIKFGALLDLADRLGADKLATGHYVRLEERNGRQAVRRGVWRAKDQSYVLAALSQEQLSRAVFPLGESTKNETRERARALGLDIAERPESQEICFIPDDDYRTFLAERLGPPRPGPIVSTSGGILGQHKGLIFYTVGQRRGLGIAAPRPLYVLRLDVERNALVVGYDEDTFCTALVTAPVNWSGLAPQKAPFRCNVQIRYLHRPAPALVTPQETGLHILFEEPQRAVTPGQWAVLYDEGDYLLAGAVIESAQNQLTEVGMGNETD